MMLREPVMFLNTCVITCSGLLRIEPPTYAVARMVELLHLLTQYCWEWEYYRLQAGTAGLLGMGILQTAGWYRWAAGRVNRFGMLPCQHGNILNVPTAIYIVVSLSSNNCTHCTSLWINASQNAQHVNATEGQKSLFIKYS